MGVIEARRRILLTTPHPVTTTPAPVASFDTDMVGKLRSAKFAFSPVQSGSGDPSPTNVRPISGWDGVTVEQAGKNLYDGTVFRIGFAGNPSSVTGSEIVTGSDLMGYYCECKPGEILTLSRANGSATPRFSIGFTKEKPSMHTALYNPYSPLNNTNTSITMTAPDDAKYVCLYLSNTDTDISAAKIQLEYGSTATDYEPYQSRSTYPVTWQSAGTIYGGYVDVCKGEVVAEYGVYTDNGTGTWTKNSGTEVGGSWRFEHSLSSYSNWSNANAPASGAACNFLKCIGSGQLYGGNDDHFALYVGILYVRIANIAEVSDLQTYFSDHPLTVVYPLEAPIHYALTPQIIKSLRGANNLWSNANGNAKVTYWTHKGGVIPDEYQRVAYIKTPELGQAQNAFVRTGIANATIGKVVCKYGVIAESNNAPIFLASYATGSGTIQRPFATVGDVQGDLTVTPMHERPWTGITDTYTVTYPANVDYNLRIGGWSDAAWTAEGAYYSVIVYDRNDTKIANFIPCYRKSDSKPGFFDTVGKGFYPSNGSKDFIIPTT